MDATVNLQLSAKSVGLFEAFYNSVKPIQLLSSCIDLPQGNAKPGKFEVDPTEIPFQFQLDPPSGQQLYETYHGVFVNITYMLKVDMIRGMLAKNLQKSLEFILEVKVKEINQLNNTKNNQFQKTKTDRIRANRAETTHF